MDELSYEQAQSIITDKNNPSYSRYHNNDKDVHAAVTKAFLKQYPGEIDLSSDASLNRQFAEAGAPGAPTANVADQGEPVALTENADVLREAYGETYRQDFETSAAHLAGMQQSSGLDPKEFRSAVEAIELQIGPVAALKLLKAAAMATRQNGVG